MNLPPRRRGCRRRMRAPVSGHIPCFRCAPSQVATTVQHFTSELLQSCRYSLTGPGDGTSVQEQAVLGAAQGLGGFAMARTKLCTWTFGVGLLTGCASASSPGSSAVVSPIPTNHQALTMDDALTWPLEGEAGADTLIAALRQVIPVRELQNPGQFSGRGPVDLADGHNLTFASFTPVHHIITVGVSPHALLSDRPSGGIDRRYCKPCHARRARRRYRPIVHRSPEWYRRELHHHAVALQLHRRYKRQQGGFAMTGESEGVRALGENARFQQFPDAIRGWILASPNAADEFSTFFAKGGKVQPREDVRLPSYAAREPPAINVNA